jgi:hypothetical protein
MMEEHLSNTTLLKVERVSLEFGKRYRELKKKMF